MDALIGWLAAIEASASADAMRRSTWLFPALETVHILGFALLFGTIVAFDLRVLGLGRRIGIADLGAYLLPWTLASLVLVVPSGLALFATQATEYLANPAFRVKLALLALAAANAIAFRFGAGRDVLVRDADAAPCRAVRLHASISLAAWIGIVTAGRLVAYV